MNIGIHAVLFKEEIQNNTDSLLASMHAAGASCFEMGARFISLENVDTFTTLLAKNDMQLSGLHVGVQLVDFMDNEEKNEQALRNAARFLGSFKNHNIIMTGAIPQEHFDSKNLGDDRLSDPQFVQEIARKIEKYALLLKQEYGVTLHYHNHNWEFKNQGLIFNTLFESAPDLCFALDIGWAAVSGYDPLQLIQKDPQRFRYLHLRDYRKDVDYGALSFAAIQERYCEIGTGDFDYQTLFAYLDSYMDKDCFCIIEYEKGAVDMNRYTRALQFATALV